ncbi:phage portal protein [Kitasatospora purpeofusca]|uniref:phage portal protein n=1 Tax=Kitasatospora purpeofusca TaxID=67352 RepID=UPI0036646B4F
MGRLADATAALFGRRTAPAAGLEALREGRPLVLSGSAMTLDLDAEARGYSNSAVAYRCVEAIASNGASVDMVVRNAAGDAIPGHPVAHLFNKRPNEQVSARLFKSIMLQQAELAGQSFVYLDRGESRTGPVQAVYNLFDPVQVIVDRPAADRPTARDILGFVVTRSDGQRIPLLPEEVLWVRYAHPFEPLGCLAPWKAARHAVDMDAYAREWQRSSYKNGGSPTGVVYLGQMGEAQYNQAVASWRSSVAGPANAGKSLLVASPPGSGSAATYSRVSLTPEEMDYLESRMANASEVMLAFGVPRDYLMGGATYENRTASKATLWSDTIKPKLDVIASEVDLRLLPSDAEDAGWDYASVDALQDSQDSVATRVRALTYVDILTVDEGRAELGLPPLPKGIGEHTLTPYRAQFAPIPGQGSADAAAPADAARLGPDIDALVERAVTRALTAVIGHQQPAPERPALARAAGRSAADVQADYDAIEAEGRSVVRRLAKEQAAAVLRDFDRLMGKPQRSAEWLAALRGQAAALAVEGQVRITAPDPERVAAAEMSELDVAAGPAGWEERIKARDVFDAKYWRKRTAEALAPFIRRAWKRGGQGVQDGFDLEQPDVARALADRVDELAGQVTATTRQVLESQLLQHGVTDGESIPALRARLQRVFADLAGYRATMIARTETVGAYNAAAVMAALEAGAVRKTWLATSDSRTRQSHRLADGQSIALNKSFRASESRWPGDPAAPAAQSINCRCTLTFQFEEK